MKWRELLDLWSLSGLQINPGVLGAEFKPSDNDKDAAWAMYVELLTRITTQPLPQEQGDERAALESVHQLFPLTRDILRSTGGRHAREFAKIAIVILNQQVRPFTSKWHRLSLTGGFDGLTGRQEFRTELAHLQDVLLRYTRLLGCMAGVEADDDLTRIEEV
ncbi:MAG: hypothetical protein AB3X44_17355 [Leptothrix sp. (in: b-proteobacteria)]